MGDWVLKRLGLRYYLGEVPLFMVRFRLAWLDRHFTELPSVPDESRIRWADMPPRSDGAVYLSHPVERPLPRLTWAGGAIRYVPMQYEHFYLDLRGSFEDYLKQFSQKQRYNLKRQVRKYAEFAGEGPIWREYKTADDIMTFYEHARQVSKTTYQERLLDVGLPDDDVFRAGLVERAGQGRARGYVLYHGERPVSYLYTRLRGDVVLYDYIGYDPQYAQWSPGSVLQYCVIEHLFGEGGFRMLDFGFGEAQYKRFFATGSAPCANIYYFRPTLRNRLLVGLHAGMDSFATTVGRRLDRLGLKDRVKKVLRNWGAEKAGA